MGRSKVKMRSASTATPPAHALSWAMGGSQSQEERILNVEKTVGEDEVAKITVRKRNEI